jgi:hypothetical protein
MSFNQNNHTHQIHLGNYEEFFVLYMDNELDAEKKLMVEAFLQEHPHLQAELNLLMETKLPLDEMPVFNAADLLSDKMKLNTASEELLLFMDGELPAARAAVLEQQLSSDPILQGEYNLLLKSKLDPSDKIIFPYKEGLYRRTERRTIPMGMWVRAAAVAVLVVSGIFFWMDGDKTTTLPPSVAVRKPGASTQAPGVNGVPEPSVQTTTGNDATGTGEQKDLSSDLIANKTPKAVPVPGKVPQPATATIQQPVIAAHTTGNNDPVVQVNRTAKPVTLTDVALKTPEEILNKPGVTSDLIQRNTIVYASNTITDEPEAVMETRKGSVKGLLRKATRLIESRTGISATNDDEELMIGAIAVKLK